MTVKEPISLAELAKLLSVNKSLLNYYAWLKLLVPVRTVGKVMLFEKKTVMDTLKHIARSKERGLTLVQIKGELEKKG